MKKVNTQKIALTAMMVALTTVGTMVIQIPALVANGYINIGDTFLMFTGLLLGPLAGFTAGSLGSALADLLSGYAIYAPITFIVKGAEGLVCALIYKKLKKRYSIVATVPAGLLMAFGYFVGECFLYSPAGAAASILGNLAQGLANAVFAMLLHELLRKQLNKAFSL
ncbi:MAG TPA: ECF transporter S component [Clostridiales bacterium]|jgi:uncharacterized membrane protein|nr:ECF transporter S component [Clostridiales bacterium]